MVQIKKEVLELILKRFKELELEKTKECPHEEIICDLVRGKLNTRKTREMGLHIENCSYCTKVYYDLIYLFSPYNEKIPEDVDKTMTSVIESIIFGNQS